MSVRNIRNLLVIALVAVGSAVTWSKPAQAQTNLFTITGLTQSPATAGQTAYFSATLTNEDPNNAVTLGQVSPDFNESYFTQDFSDDYNNNVNDLITVAPFNANDPAASQYTGEILAVAIDPTTPTGTYSESLQIFDAAGDFPPLATQDFSITVSAVAVPEAGALRLLALGLCCMIPFARKACRRQA